MERRAEFWFALLLSTGAACSSNPGPSLEARLRANGGTGDTDAGAGAQADGGTSVQRVSILGAAAAQPAMVDANPTSPTSGGATLGWSSAPQMGQVNYVADRDSVSLILPAVPGAVDYRAIVLAPGVGVTSDSSGHETVTGATIVCAGYLQRNVLNASRQLIDTIQVPGVAANSHIVLEAISSACPFTGVIGSTHFDLDRTTATNPEILSADSNTYSVYTEAEMTKTYGSAIFNGQGTNPKTGMPAPASAPAVLQRTTVVVSPLGTSAPAPVSTFFDDFSAADQPKLLESGADSTTHPFIDIFQNSKWTFEAAGMDVDQYFIDRGQLHAVVADGAADVFGSAVAYPRKLAQLSDTAYLHITYDVNSIVSDRRYWWISVCGADQAGKTIAANGAPASFLDPDSSLQEGDGNNPNQSGYNCINVFPKNGAINDPLPLGDGTSPPPETDVRILIYKTGTGVTGSNVSPDQYKNGYLSPSWYREMNGAGKLVGPMLDQQNLSAPTTHYDLFVRRDRVIMYANGQQKFCNDYPATLVTMSEAMVGFGQVLYHTSAEHNEITNGSFMKYVYGGPKYFDRRDWDNLGFDVNVQPPASFNQADCFKWTAP